MLRRKDRGILEHFLPAIVVIVLMAILWTGSMISASNINKSSDVHQAARACMLRMESDGYLTEENRIMLMERLQELDMEQIDLTGTTFTDAGYGNQIQLVISGKIKLAEIDFRSFRTAIMSSRKVDVSIEKVSVAKN